MPRLNHRKTRTGCQRCKARKVKCDEGRPRCSACERHNVVCEYAYAASASTSAAPSATPPSHTVQHHNNGPEYGANDPRLDPVLELRLIHEWTAYTSKSFSTTWEFWMYQAPLVAFEFRYVLDAMLALSALHASRQPLMQWHPMDGRMVPIHGPVYNSEHPERDLGAKWKFEGMNIGSAADEPPHWANWVTDAGNNAFLASKRSYDMLHVSRLYFDRAIDGHRNAISAGLTLENIEAVYMAAALVLFMSVFVLSENDDDSTLPAVDWVQWLRLSKGIRIICERWHELVGPSWIHRAGVFYGLPDMTDATELFRTEHGKPFLKLLTYAEDFETIDPDDREVYKKVISYVGLLYKGIRDGTETELMSCRRIIAMPSRNKERFVDFVEAKQPRALAIMAHLFACTKLIADKVLWFKGVAERQVPKIYAQMPVGWQPMLAWPLAIVNGELDRQPKETEIHDILAL